jgi:hypothetical protein
MLGGIREQHLPEQSVNDSGDIAQPSADEVSGAVWAGRRKHMMITKYGAALVVTSANPNAPDFVIKYWPQRRDAIDEDARIGYYFCPTQVVNSMTASVVTRRRRAGNFLCR